MDNILRQIITVDKKSKEKVAKAHEERQLLDGKLSEAKSVYEKKYIQEAEQILNQLKKQNDDEYNKFVSKQDALFNEKVKELDILFRENSEAWVNAIFKNVVSPE